MKIFIMKWTSFVNTINNCSEKYDFEGLTGHNIKDFEQSNLTKTR